MQTEQYKNHNWTTTTTSTTSTIISAVGVVIPLATSLRLSMFSDSTLARTPFFGRSPTSTFYPFQLQHHFTPSSMLNPALHPFIPLCSKISAPLHPAHVWKKQYWLYMFPFITQFQQLTASQCACLHFMRRPLVQRLKQLKLCAKLLEQSKSVPKDLNLLQSTFADLAEQVHAFELWSTMIQSHLYLMFTHTSGCGKESPSAFVVWILMLYSGKFPNFPHVPDVLRRSHDLMVSDF